MTTAAPLLKYLGQVPYEPTWRAMQVFTDQRTAETDDEIWFLEHPPVFTQGLNGKPEHVLFTGDIPVVPIDRGGQVTYHGPGQLVIYPLIDVRRHTLGVRELVMALENSVIRLMADYGVEAQARRDAPGVYVEGRKLASIGLRIRRGCSYHGMALNVNMDLNPFQCINPCGYQGLEVIDIQALAAAQSVGKFWRVSDVARTIAPYLLDALKLPKNTGWVSAPPGQEDQAGIPS